MTAHEILEDGRIKEVEQVTGGPFGGIFVDQKFVSLLEKKFGIQAVKNYRAKYPADWLRLMNDFEMKKRGKRTLEGKDTRVILPQTFIRFVSDFSSSTLSGNLERSCSISDVEVYNDEYLCLGPSAMKQLFEPVVSGIVSHMTTLLKKPSLRNINALLMVGGFAESAILQNAIRKALGSRCKILIPRDARIAVVQGATMFGQTSTIVSSRVMATTYGFRCFANFDPKIHPLEKKEIYDGDAKCKDIFKVVVTENDVVKVGERKVFTQVPVYSDQTLVEIMFFTSKDPSVKYTTDPPVGPSIGKMTVKSPDISKGTNRPIEISIYFGGTEIQATALDKTSGNTATVNLDFLCKS